MKKNHLCHYVQQGVTPATLFWPLLNCFFLIKPEDIKISTVTFAQVEFISLMYFHGEESVSRKRMNEQIQERPDLPRFPFCHLVIGLEGSLGLI